MKTTNVDLLKKATRQVCEEAGEPWPDGADEEFDDPDVRRFADAFAELVLTEHTAELEQENRLMRNRLEMADKALNEWLDKTKWVIESLNTCELGLHRADIMRTRIECLQVALKEHIIQLSAAEIQSGHDRVKWAEGGAL